MLGKQQHREGKRKTTKRPYRVRSPRPADPRYQGSASPKPWMKRGFK